jgi:hypothetical protein
MLRNIRGYVLGAKWLAEDEECIYLTEESIKQEFYNLSPGCVIIWSFQLPAKKRPR